MGNLTARPLEVVHDFTFVPIHMPQDREMLPPFERIDRLASLGYGGIVMNVRLENYLEDESAIKEFGEWARYAKSKGLRIWIYDEKLYPSGSAGGLLVHKYPEYEAKTVALASADADDTGMIYINSPCGCGNAIAAFTVELDENGDPDFGTVTDVSAKVGYGGGLLLDACGRRMRGYCFFERRGFEYCRSSYTGRTVRRVGDLLSKEAVDKYLELTLSAYKKALGNISDCIDAIFTDEPQLCGFYESFFRPDISARQLSGEIKMLKFVDRPDDKTEVLQYIPWTDGMEKRFAADHGHALLPLLPYIFADEGEKGRSARREFWATVSNLYHDSFADNFRRTCEKLGVCFTGHAMAEEWIWQQPYYMGEMLKQLGAMTTPGCDILYATTDKILFFGISAKFASSASEFYGRDGCMTEASNMARDIMPITADVIKLATGLEYALGVTKFTSYYVEDALPENDIKQWCDECGFIGDKIIEGHAVRPVCVYLPYGKISEYSYPVSYEGFTGRDSRLPAKLGAFLGRISEALLRADIDFNFINDEILERLAAGNSSPAFAEGTPRVLVVPPDTMPDQRLTAYFDKVITADTAQEIRDTLLSLGLSTVSTDKPSKFLSIHRRNGDTDTFLIVNYGEDFSGSITPHFVPAGKNASVYRTDTAERTEAQIENGAVSLDIPSGKSVIIEY